MVYKAIKIPVTWYYISSLILIMIIQAFKKTIKFGEGYYPIKKDAEESGKFIYGIWSLI